MTTDVLFLTKRWMHHTPSGGYDRAAETFGGTVVARPPTSQWLKALRWTIDRKWHPDPYLLDYTYEDLWAERRLVAKTFRHRFPIVHVLYGDEQLDLVLRLKKRLGFKLVVSFHLPWFRSRERFEAHKELLNSHVDAAVCVSQDLADDINRFFGREIAYFVPHGIDTTIFRPESEITNNDGRLRLLTVGAHMRDMNLIHRVIDFAAINHLPIDFAYIGPRNSWAHFTGCQNVALKCDVSESELIAAYNDADALLLPVTAATANNSLLEALACGLPVISTQTGGIPDYLSEESGWLLPPNDQVGLDTLVRRLCNNPSEANEKRNNAVEMAKRFDWSKTSSMLDAVYQKLLAD